MASTSVFVRFFGRVQGVGFRALVVREANKMGITGWVRNSGHEDLVEAVFCGEKASVDSLISGLKKPLGFIRVDRVAVEVLQNSEEFKVFQTKY